MTSTVDDRTHASSAAVSSVDGVDPASLAEQAAVAVAASVLSEVAREAPRINALQKLWLREIGIEKTWLQAAEPPPLAQPTADVADKDAAAGEAVPQTEAGRPAADASRLAGRPSASSTGRDAVPARPVSTPTRPSAEPASTLARPAAGATPAARAPSPQPQVATVVAATDFDALREQVQQCEACGLCQGRRHAVFGMGARPARWMVVGEAPGEQEDRQGLPFVGRSGQLLDAMLSAVGMSREKDVFISNVIKCRPPGNRNPKPEEIAACSPYLRRQIELIRPERILVVGRFAAQTLLGTDATIGSLRGRLHSWTLEDGQQIPVVVSYHPAYLLRSPAEKARAWQDLQLAVSLTA